MTQAESDYRAARRLDDEGQAATRCQAISKYQQCVEKSVKAVIDRLESAGVTVGDRIDDAHPVARYVGGLRRLPPTPDNRDLRNQLVRLFGEANLRAIRLLDALVPAYPRRGEPARRNHEYPYQDQAGTWRAPAEADAFTRGEVKRARTCAGNLMRVLPRILSALDLLYP